MADRYKKVAKKFFIILNLLAAFVFLLACLAPYLNPVHWWVISILGLGFPIVLALLVGFIIFWLIVRPKYLLISLISLLLGWNSIAVFFAFHPNEVFAKGKDKNTLRVVHWNVARFKEWRRNNNKGSQTRLKMMEQLKKQKADVLCLSEFFHSTDSIYYDNLNYVRNKLGFPYYYFSWDEDGGEQWVGQVIFSKHPIVDSGMIRFPRPGMPEALVFADIVFQNDTVRFYTTHLQSVQFKKEDYKTIEEIKNRDRVFENSKNIFTKLRRGLIFRSQQANLVKQTTQKSPHPYVLTGDLNDVPNSYTYKTIRGEQQDAFLKKGFGIGRTYSGLSPTLRIDYILPPPSFPVLQFDRVVNDYSDHYMLVADLKIR